MKIFYLITLMQMSFITASDNFQINEYLLKTNEHITFVTKKLLQLTTEKDLLHKKKTLLPEDYKSQSKEELINKFIRLEKKYKKIINLSFACHKTLIFLLEEKKSLINREIKWADLYHKRSLLLKEQQNNIKFLEKKNEYLLTSIKVLYVQINIKNNKINELVHESTLGHIFNWFNVNS